jgi:WD40 repeat protein
MAASSEGYQTNSAAGPIEVSPMDSLDPAQIPATERFAWQPKELVAVIGSHRWRHWGQTISVAFHPGGEILASGGDDCFVRLWDLEGHEKGALAIPNQVRTINALAFRPDGQVLLASGDDGLIYAWDISGSAPVAMAPIQPTRSTRPKELGMLAGASSIDAIAFTRDGKWLACSMGRQADARIFLWDASNWPPIELPTLPQATAPFAFSADGETLVTQSHSGNILVWDLAGEQPRLTASGQLSQPRNQMLTMAISPDGKSLVTCHGDLNNRFVLPGEPDGDVILWDLTSNPPKPKAVFGSFKYDPMFWMTPSAAFRLDGKSLVFAAREDRVELWDISLNTPKKISDLPGNVRQPGTLAFAPNGQQLASVGTGVVLWDLANASLQLRSTRSPLAGSVFVSPDGRRLATVEISNEEPLQFTRVWDLTGPRPEPLEEMLPSFPLGFGEDGMLVTMDFDEVPSDAAKPKTSNPMATFFPQALRRWDVSGKVPQDKGAVSLPSLEDFSPRSFAFGWGVQTSRASVILGENRNGDLLLLRLLNQREVKFCRLPIPRESELHPSAYSADGTVFAAAMGRYENRKVKVWDITGNEAQERGTIEDATLPSRVQVPLPDGTFVDGGPGVDRPLNVWGIELASEGKAIALADIDGPIQVWSLTGKEPRLQSTLVGHTPDRVMGAIRSLAFSSDGKQLVSIGGDQKLIVWDIASSDALHTAHLPDGTSISAKFAPDNRHVVTSNSDGTAYVLRLPPRP